MNDTIALLKRRRSAPPAIMTGPAPTREELKTILTIASRVPDHGKLAPWRFITFEGEARQRAGQLALDIRLADKPHLNEAGKADELRRFVRAPLVVCVVSRALGFANTWLTEWPAYDARFRSVIGLADHERIAGFIYIGKAVDIEDRPRPPLDDIVTAFPPEA